MILSELCFDNLISELRKSHTTCGPKGYPVQTLINTFIAMQVEQIPTLKNLSEKLKTNPILRYCCGFELLGKTPSPATLSRFLTKLSMTTSLEQEFNNLVKKAINEVKAIPIIAYNKRGAYAALEGFNEDFQPVCSMGYPLTYWGKDGNYLKYRCPHATGKIDCPEGTCWCSNSNYGYCEKININNNPRLKELLNVDNLRSAGILKAKAFALLNCIALVSGTISVNRVKNNNLSVA